MQLRMQDKAPPQGRSGTIIRRTRLDFPCHCEERSDVAIRSLSGPSGTGRCFAPQGMRIAPQAFPSVTTSGFALLAMTCIFLTGPFDSAWRSSKAVANSAELAGRFVNRPYGISRAFPRYFGIVMVSTISASVSLRSDTAPMPAAWIRERDWVRLLRNPPRLTLDGGFFS